MAPKNEKNQPAEAPQAPAAAVIHAAHAFGRIMFEAVSGHQEVYDGRGGVRSKRKARAQVEMIGPNGKGTGHYIAGTVYARQKPDGSTDAEFVFFGSRNQSCMRVGSPAAKVALDEWRASAGVAYIQWAKEQKQGDDTETPQAPAVQTGVSMPNAERF